MSQETIATIEDFVYTIGLHGKERTMQDYSRIIRAFFSYSKKDISEITTKDVFDFIAHEKKIYKPKSVQVHLSVLKSYLSEYAPQVRAKKIRTLKAYADHPSDVFTPEEYVAMLSHVGAKTENDVRDNMLIRILYDTGARISEIHYLLNHPEIIQPDRSAYIKTAKTAQMRLIMWGKDTDVFLRVWLSFECQLISIRQCQRIIKKYASKAKIDKKITPHSFRHTKAHKILDNGGSIKDISEVLGHSSLFSSQHYLNENSQRRLVRQQKWL